MRCIRECFHRAHHYKVGDSYTPTPEEVKGKKVPRHFVSDQEFTKELVEETAISDELAIKEVKIRAKKASQDPPE